MKKLTLFCLLISNSLFGQKIFPAIKSGGGMFKVSDQVPVADKNLKYKVIVDIHEGVPKPDSLNGGMEKMARLINLYMDSGIPKENIEISAIFHFTATPVILNDEAYTKKFGVPNPNTKLMNEMAAWGAKFYICGQSLHMRKLVNEPRNSNVQVVQSAMVYLSTKQLKGYVVILP